MKLTDHLPHGFVTVIIILVGIFVIYQTGALNKAVSLAENAANRNSDNVLHVKDAFDKVISEKDKKIKQTNGIIVNLEHDIANISHNYVTLQDSLIKAKTPNDIIRIQKGQITELTAWNKDLTQECAFKDNIISTCNQQKLLMKARIDTLETTLSNQVASTKCHILFFGCPSRVASFETGGLMGILATIIVVSVLHR